MKQLVIMPGGFHPFHAGHLALYNSARQAFPNADVKVAATNDTSNRPFPFKLKEKLAQLAGVSPGDFYQVKSPFRADEITQSYNPTDTQLIFVRSEKDATKPPQPGGVKRDGTPAYLQPIGNKMAPMTQHAYMAYLPTVEFGPGMTSATQIRTAWPELTERQRTALVMSLYPTTQSNPRLAKNVVEMLNTVMGADVAEEVTVDEGSIPVYNPPSQFYAGAGKTLYKLFRNAFPNLPEHVANDIYNQTLPGTNDTIVNAIKKGEDPKNVFLNYYSGVTFNFVKDPGTNLTSDQMKNVLLKGIWKQKILNVNPADFSEHSRNRMIKRNFGVNHNEDPTRIQRQQSGARSDGSNEPVIIIQTSDGLTLWEGFHRTMSILALGRNGEDPLRWNKVKLRAWVVEIPSQQGVDEQVTRQMSQGGMRASYQSKYNQPVAEDYLDEARS
jgi:hypothetical protein